MTVLKWLRVFIPWPSPWCSPESSLASWTFSQMPTQYRKLGAECKRGSSSLRRQSRVERPCCCTLAYLFPFPFHRSWFYHCPSLGLTRVAGLECTFSEQSAFIRGCLISSGYNSLSGSNCGSALYCAAENSLHDSFVLYSISKSRTNYWTRCNTYECSHYNYTSSIRLDCCSCPLQHVVIHVMDTIFICNWSAIPKLC